MNKKVEKPEDMRFVLHFFGFSVILYIGVNTPYVGGDYVSGFFSKNT